MEEVHPQRLKERQIEGNGHMDRDVVPSPMLCPRFRSLLSLRLILFPRPFLDPAPVSAKTPFHNCSAVTVNTNTPTQEHTRLGNIWPPMAAN